MTPLQQFNSAAPVAWPSGRPRTQQRVYRHMETKVEDAYDGRCFCSTLRLKPVMQDVNGQMLPVMMFAEEEHGHFADEKKTPKAVTTCRVVAPALPEVNAYWHEPIRGIDAPILPLYHAAANPPEDENLFPLTRWAYKKLLSWLK